MNKPTLFLLCGVAGSGKTTLAKRLAQSGRLHLCLDEWTAVDGDLDYETIAELQWLVAAQALQLGIDVILDWGFDSRGERDEFRGRATAVGADVKLIFLDAPRDQLLERIALRNRTVDPQFHVTEAEVDAWLGQFERPGADELVDQRGES